MFGTSGETDLRPSGDSLQKDTKAADNEKPKEFREMSDAKGSIDPGVTRKPLLDQTSLPCTATHASFAINDLGYQQHILSNDDNFAESTSCDIFEIRKNGRGQWMRDLGDAGLQAYLKVSVVYLIQNSDKSDIACNRLDLSQPAL
jgi:hypothetical protein